MWTDLRLKLRHWLRKYGKILVIAISIWGIIFLLNLYLKKQAVVPTPVSNYKPHSSIIQTNNSTPKNLQQPIEDMIEKYVNYCNDSNFIAAYEMISDECKEYAFSNKLENFINHVAVKMPMRKKYGIQNYSETVKGNKNLYIYEVRYYDDYITTGLTNTEFRFTTEKFIFSLNKDDKIEMSIGDFVYSTPIKSISENEYLKIDVMNKIVRYSEEKYQVKFTNRSNYTIVISDDQEKNEVNLLLPNETRPIQNRNDIVLRPQEQKEIYLEFPKFSDDGDMSQKLIFSSIRVMEKYSGTDIDEAVIQSEIDNAITKFSMEVGIGER